MDKKKIGEVLTPKREQLGLSFQEMGERIGCNRTTIMRIENGTSNIRRGNLLNIARAYEIELKELAALCGYQLDQLPVIADSQIIASVADLEFLITVARGLEKPMSIALIRELLKCRQSNPLQSR